MRTTSREEVISMPGGDGTGPMGMGPLTGRRAGFCSGFATSGFLSPLPGYGRNFGRGRGFRMSRFSGLPGWAGTGFSALGGAYASQGNEQEILGKQAELLEKQLQWVKQQLAKVEAKAE